MEDFFDDDAFLAGTARDREIEAVVKRTQDALEVAVIALGEITTGSPPMPTAVNALIEMQTILKGGRA